MPPQERCGPCRFCQARAKSFQAMSQPPAGEQGLSQRMFLFVVGKALGDIRPGIPEPALELASKGSHAEVSLQIRVGFAPFEQDGDDAHQGNPQQAGQKMGQPQTPAQRSLQSDLESLRQMHQTDDGPRHADAQHSESSEHALRGFIHGHPDGPCLGAYVLFGRGAEGHRPAERLV